MLDFKPIQLSDKAWVDPLVFQEDSPSADFNFGNMYMWDESFHQQICPFGGRLIVTPRYGSEPFFAWPVGGGELRPVLEELRLYAGAQGFPFVLRGVLRQDLPRLEQLYPGRLRIREDRDFWDYLYDADSLASLSGKKLHGQRNHCNRFEKDNDWSFRSMTAEDAPVCRAFLDRWLETLEPGERDGVRDEYKAIHRGLDAFDKLGLEGGLLFAGGALAGFTMGEVISSDTFNVHFEKALRDMAGAYAMVNREFVRRIQSTHPHIRRINREDDTGRESLRRAKLSYHPACMAEKHTVVISHV